MSAVLEVEGISVDYRAHGSSLRALHQVTLTVDAGETVGVIGESGSGKSTLAYAIAGYLPANASIAAGRIRIVGTDINGTDADSLKPIRRHALGMVYQNAAAALNPTQRIGRQVIEAVTVTGTPPEQAAQQALELLAQVQLRDPAAMMQRFPHEASGGERQRVLIAMAIAGNPRLLLLDEPTTALDPDTARGILDLIATLRDRLGAGVLYISHDLETVSRLTNRLLIFQGGTVVEEGTTSSVLNAPQSDYTKLLLASRPGKLAFNRDIAAVRLARGEARADPVLSIRNLSVTYRRSGLFARLAAPPAKRAALHEASLDILAGETTALVGRSGSGKSTLAKALVGLVPFAGTVSVGRRDYAGARELDRPYRRAVQIVFQNPDSSLNPRHRIGEILSRPLHLLGEPAGAPRVSALLEQVRLPPEFANRFPHQLSGGQRQRASIARALAARPRLIICDEITSALDVSTQAAIIALLRSLQAEHGTAFLFISHDLELVRSFADHTIVIDDGRIVSQQ